MVLDIIFHIANIDKSMLSLAKKHQILFKLPKLLFIFHFVFWLLLVTWVSPSEEIQHIQYLNHCLGLYIKINLLI